MCYHRKLLQAGVRKLTQRAILEKVSVSFDGDFVSYIVRLTECMCGVNVWGGIDLAPYPMLVILK